jgi:polysaccharide export outer membrane protein
MRNKILPLAMLFLIIGVCVFAASSLFALDEASGSKYTLGASDVLEISVWSRADLTRQVTVRPDGWISYPLIGEVYVTGSNPAQLSETIKEKLLTYLRNPVVSVNVLHYRSKKILVLGEVKLPGLYQFEGNMTVFNAIGLAGGYKAHAELKNVLIVRNASFKPKKPDFYVVNLHKVIHDGNASENLALVPGDIVYVPQNVMGNIGDFMDYYLSRIQPAADSYGAITSGQPW